MRNAERGNRVTFDTATAIANALNLELKALEPSLLEEENKTTVNPGLASSRFLNIAATRLRDIRKEKGFSPLTLADKSGLAPRTIENAEKGKNVTFFVVRCIMDALGVDWDEILALESNYDTPREMRHRMRTAVKNGKDVMMEAVCQSDRKPVPRTALGEYVISHVMLLADLGYEVAFALGRLQNATALVELVAAAANQGIMERIAQEEKKSDKASPSQTLSMNLLMELLSPGKKAPIAFR